MTLGTQPDASSLPACHPPALPPRPAPHAMDGECRCPGVGPVLPTEGGKGERVKQPWEAAYFVFLVIKQSGILVPVKK